MESKVPDVRRGRRIIRRQHVANVSRSVRRRISAPRRQPNYIVPRNLPIYHFGDQPPRKRALLKYVCHETIASIGAGAIVVKEYRANGMYDPEVGVGGHQPYGFDQLMTQYYHFTVIGATFEIECQTHTDSPQIWMGMVYNNTGTAASAYASGGVNGLNEMPVVSNTMHLNSVTPVKGQYRMQRLWASMPRIFGKPAYNLVGDSRFQGDDSKDPDEQAYFALVGYVPNGTESDIGSFFKIKIVYDAVFTEPRFFVTS